MSTIKFVKKEPSGPMGNFKYIYECTCANGDKKKRVEIQAANENEAKQLAQMECDEQCGENEERGPPV